MCVPLPGYSITINHQILIEIDFAYTSGEIVINAGASLQESTPGGDLWVSGTGYLSNSGHLEISNIHYEGNNGSLMNAGSIQSVNMLLTTGLDNIGHIVTDSLYNNLFLTNYGMIETTALTNVAMFINSGGLRFTDYTNNGDFQNVGGICTGTHNMWNQGKIINHTYSEIEIGHNLLNSNQQTFDALIENNGLMFVGNNFYNVDTIRGVSGYVEVGDSSVNSGFMLGTFDFCDLTPPVSVPFVDINFGTIGPGISWCQQQNIAESQVQKIVFFQNPVEDILYVSIPCINNCEIRIFDNSGREVYRKTESDKNPIVDVSWLHTGTYTFSLKTGTQIRSYVFIKR